MPSASPPAKAVRTTSTRGACQSVPKKKCTATVCWLFSAKAKSVKKMAALSSHIRYFTGNPRSGLAIVASHGEKTRRRLPGIRDCQQFFSASIDAFTQCLSWLEMRHPLFGNGDAFSRPGIPPHARRPSVDGETAKTPDFNPVAAHQCVAHRIKKGLDGKFGITVCQLAKSGRQFFYEIASGHSELSNGDGIHRAVWPP